MACSNFFGLRIATSFWLLDFSLSMNVTTWSSSEGFTLLTRDTNVSIYSRKLSPSFSPFICYIGHCHSFTPRLIDIALASFLSWTWDQPFKATSLDSRELSFFMISCNISLVFSVPVVILLERMPPSTDIANGDRADGSDTTWCRIKHPSQVNQLNLPYLYCWRRNYNRGGASSPITTNKQDSFTYRRLSRKT